MKYNTETIWKIKNGSKVRRNKVFVPNVEGPRGTHAENE